VGIHKGGVETKINGTKMKVNSGRLFTSELIDVLLVEAKRIGADLFEVDKHLPLIMRS
jgi:hypothetical protein